MFESCRLFLEHDSSCRNELFKFFVTKLRIRVRTYQIMPADPDSHALNKHPHSALKCDIKAADTRSIRRNQMVYNKTIYIVLL
jgi:hypothetical protein